MTRRYPIRKRSALVLRRRRSTLRCNFICSESETDSSSSSFSSSSSSNAKPSFVEISDEDLTSEIDSNAIDSTEKETDLVVTKVMDLTGPGRVRVDPVQESEESTVIDAVISPPPSQLQERNRTDGSLLLGLVFKAIEFQFNLMTRLVKSPPLLLSWGFLFPFDPFTTFKLGRRFLLTQFSLVTEILSVTLKLSGLKDTKRTVNVACKFGWGLFRAARVGFVLFGLLVLAFMLGGFVITRIADKPFVIKEVLNFDYTKNSPEAFVPITSCAGVACDGSCKESNEMVKIRGLRAIPKDHKLEIILSLTLPESYYNKNLGMFQVRVDFLSADGQTLDTIRRPCMLRFRSEPIRLVQTFLKVVPLVTGYVSEIQTLRLKLKGFAEKETPTACLKVMIEQRAEFRSGAGIPELYDASLSLESDLPFFKRAIWKWRKTLFVWISMSLFFTEFLFTLVCCRSLIIPRTRLKDIPASNPTKSI